MGGVKHVDSYDNGGLWLMAGWSTLNLTIFKTKIFFFYKNPNKYVLNYFVNVRVGHSVLFRSVRYVLFRSKKRTFRSFPFFSRVFGDL